MSFDLKDYVDVKTRIALFYERFPDGRLVTDSASMSEDADGAVRVWCKALAYRTADDPHPAVGWSYLGVPGTTNYTRGSEIENAETSAWGRAIGALGIGIEKGIASAQEVAAKQDDGKAPPPAETMHDGQGGLIGTVEERKAPADMHLRQGRLDDDPPEDGPGPIYGFGLVGPGGRGKVQVIARGALAEALALAGLKVGERVKLDGSVVQVPWTNAQGRRLAFTRLLVSRVEAPEWTLPALEAVEDDLSDLPTDWGGLPLAAPNDWDKPTPEPVA